MNFTNQDLLSLEEKVISIVTATAELLETHWEEQKEIKYKELFERVTHFDKQIEIEIRSKLRDILPDAGFYVEEGETSGEKDYMWSIDPIDGTNNFIGNIPLFFVQVALVFQSQPILGVLYNPATRQLFSASQGNGARHNRIKILQRTVTDIKKVLVDIDFGGNNGNIEWKTNVFTELAKHCNRVRASGGLYGPYIAFGGIDAFLVLNEKTKIVDQMPRIIWMKELGLKVEQFEIDNHKIMLATNSVLFPQIKQFTKKGLET